MTNTNESDNGGGRDDDADGDNNDVEGGGSRGMDDVGGRIAESMYNGKSILNFHESDELLDS